MKGAGRLLVSLSLAAALAVALLPAVAGAAPQPSDASQEVVVWAMNTGNASPKGCNAIGGCNQDLFSKRAQTLADCPDVMLAQEIRSIAQANSLKRELDQIGGACGTYRRYFYDLKPKNTDDTEIAKVAIAWRYDRFGIARDENGALQVEKHREMWNELNNEEREICDQTTTNGPRDDEDNHTAGPPSRYLSAVKLLDKKDPGRAIVAASIHWDGGMSTYCFEENSRVFAEAIQARWPGLPIVMGGDHNKLAWFSKDWVERRREAGTNPWHANLTNMGFLDVIRSTYSNSEDANADGNVDMCEQYTTGIHVGPKPEDLHNPRLANKCDHPKHSRIDFLWAKNFQGIVYAQTDRARNGRHRWGNYYADHRPITTRLSY